ncbi:MAG: ABC transporter substrate-binding protein [Acidimicrobiales bacterium]
MTMFAVVLGGCGSHLRGVHAPASPELLRVGYVPSLAGGAVPAIGSTFGWFKAAGVRVDFTPFTNGADLAGALLDGRLDIGMEVLSPIINQLAGHGEIVAFDDIDNDDSLFVSATSGITSLAQLRGKTVGVTKGTLSEDVLDMALASAGLSESDIHAVDLAPPGLVSAFAGGQLAAASVFLPYAASLTSISGVHVLARASDFLSAGGIPLVWMASDHALATKERSVSAYLDVASKVLDYRAANLSRSAQIVYRFSRAPTITPFEEQITAERWLTSKQMLAFYDAGGPQQAISAIENMLAAAGSISGTVPAFSLLDLAADRQALQNTR